jgi:hypothetical protein
MPRPLRRSSLGVVAPSLLALGLACAHQRGAGTQHASAPVPPPTEVVLSVTNHHFLDITVYVEHDGQRTRVGTVTAVSSEQFILPMRLLGMSREFQLLGQAIGSSEFVRTERLSIQPGQIIEWTLEHDLRRSSVGVY